MLTAPVNIAPRMSPGSHAGERPLPSTCHLARAPYPLSLIAPQQPDMLIMLLSTAGGAGTTMHTGARLAAARGRLLTPEVKRWLLPRSPSPRPPQAHPTP